MWLVSLPYPADQSESEAELTRISKRLSSDGLGRIFPFELPMLSVGTLDILMGLSDDIVKLNLQVEGVLKKLERQYLEAAGPGSTDQMRVNGVNVSTYLKDFHWDIARFRYSSVTIADIICQIQAIAAGIDEESKRLTATLGEKTQTLSLMQRKRLVNLSTSDFEDFLSIQEMNDIQCSRIDSDIFQTVAIAVPVNLEEEFLSTYSTIGGDIAAFGGPEWDVDDYSLGTDDGNYGPYSSRSRVKGSPVTPSEPKKLFSTTESVLYSIVVLKGHYQAGTVQNDGTFSEGHFADYIQPLITAAREKKFVGRELSFDADKVKEGAEAKVNEANQQLQHVQTRALQWSQAHFGEMYSGYIHLKAIRLFIESVLRYGLHAGKPARYQTFFLEPSAGKEKTLEETLINLFSSMRPDLGIEAENYDEEDVGGGAGGENLPFVCDRFKV
jgi:V-type H+-transporting ATPase subunit C